MKKQTTETLVVIALAMAAVVLLLCFRSLSAELVYPLERGARGFARRVAFAWTGFFSESSSAAECARLRREVASLAFVRDEAAHLAAENDRLRETLGYRDRTRPDWIPAAVLSRDGAAGGARRTLRVDKGALDGIVRGSPVAVPRGLVGRVLEVTPHTSVILLVTDSSLKVACEMETAGGLIARGILVGGSDELLLLRHLSGVPSEAVRARVLTSGLGGFFPKGIEVGTLLGVRKGPNGLASEGEVLPAVDCSTLEDVFIRREK